MMLTKLTKDKLEKIDIDFTITPKINSSEIVTYNTITSNFIIEEDTYADFSIFCQNWTKVSTTNNQLNNIDNVVPLTPYEIPPIIIDPSSIATSVNGKFSVLSSSLGGIYQSTDYGFTFILIDEFDFNDITYDGTIVYNSVAISGDGSKMIATGNIGTIMSNNYGYTWTVLPYISINKNSISMSLDGKIIYIETSDTLNISKDYGITWNTIVSNKHITSSFDGRRLISFTPIIESNLYNSNDYANTFTISNSPSKIWKYIKMSASGQYQTAITDTLEVWISHNYGFDWNKSITVFHEPITDLTIGSSGKYQVISTNEIYYSKDYGYTWRSYDLEDLTLKCVCLSYNGKVCITGSTSHIFNSIINTEYIKDVGMNTFHPLDLTLFGTIWTSGSQTDLNTEIGTNRTRIATCKYGKYQTICIKNQNIWVSNNYGVTFTSIVLDSFKLWNSIALSEYGEYQTIVTEDGEIWRSDDYGLVFIKIQSTGDTTFGDTAEDFTIFNGIAMSGNGKYQTACCKSGRIGTSNDFGYTWIYSTIGSVDFTVVDMSKNGQYQTVCGLLDGDNDRIYYSKTYGSIWNNSNCPSVSWNDISISETGQFQLVCGPIDNSGTFKSLAFSTDYGVNFIQNEYGVKDWVSVSISPNGDRQVLCTSDGKIWISTDFGATAEESTTIINSKFCRLTSSLQYIIVLKTSGISFSKIPNDLHIPGVITVSTKGNINSNAVILLSGSRQNIYSYRIINHNTFDIISSDFEDSGQCSYSIQSYGQYSE